MEIRNSADYIATHIISPRRSLWSRALDELDETERQRIVPEPPDKLQALSEVLAFAQQAAQEYWRRWTFTGKDGKKLILTDLFRKIAKWTELFARIEKVFSIHDSNYALPWAGILFLLKVGALNSELHL